MYKAKMRKVARTVFIAAAFAACLLMPPSGLPVNPTQAASVRQFGYYDTWYTDGTYSVECGYYNSCTRQRVGCQFTGYKITETIVCN